MFLLLPIMPWCSALKIYLLCSILYLRTRTSIVVRITFMVYLYTSLHEQFTTCGQFKKDCLIRVYLWMVFKYSYLLPRYALSYDDCSIRAYQSFITIFHTCWHNRRFWLMVSCYFTYLKRLSKPLKTTILL